MFLSGFLVLKFHYVEGYRFSQLNTQAIGEEELNKFYKSELMAK
jgi:hypothetical protein